MSSRERATRLARSGLLRVPAVRRLAARRGIGRPYRQLLATGQVEPLGAEVLRATDAYAADVLGDAMYAGELRFYAALQGSFREGLVPASFFAERVMPNLSSREVRRLGFTRSLLSTVVGRDSSPDLGHRIGGRWVDADLLPTTRARIAGSAGARGSEVVVKVNGSRSGMGVEVLPVTAFRDVEPHPGTDVTVQAFVTPHPDLARLSPGATPPVRILTVIDGDGPRSVASHVRFGSGATRVVGDLDALWAAVSQEGRIVGPGIDQTFRLHTRHPATGIAIDGVSIPSFAAAVERCLAGHRRFPQAGIVGWDVAVDAAGAVHLLEWNLFSPGILFQEALAGPSFLGFGWERFARTSPDA